MSAVDPNVRSLTENNLQLTERDLTAADYGEQFSFVLTRENQEPLTAARENRLVFPVNPEEWTWNQTRSIGTYDILNAPQATQVGNMQVRTFSISSFFPTIWEDDYCIPFKGIAALDKDPQESIQWLHNTQRAGYPLMLSVLKLRGGPEIFTRQKVVISALSHSYRAGNPTDVFFDLELTELVEPTIIRVSTAGPVQPTWKPPNHKYVTRPGDSLVDIARMAYGKDFANTYWKLIRDGNKTVIYKKKKHKLRTARFKANPKPKENLLVNQHLYIPRPKNVPR
jgi:hypothetical protein